MDELPNDIAPGSSPRAFQISRWCVHSLLNLSDLVTVVVSCSIRTRHYLPPAGRLSTPGMARAWPLSISLFLEDCGSANVFLNLSTKDMSGVFSGDDRSFDFQLHNITFFACFSGFGSHIAVLAMRRSLRHGTAPTELRLAAIHILNGGAVRSAPSTAVLATQ